MRDFPCMCMFMWGNSAGYLYKATHVFSRESDVRFVAITNPRTTEYMVGSVSLQVTHPLGRYIGRHADLQQPPPTNLPKHISKIPLFTTP